MDRDWARIPVCYELQYAPRVAFEMEMEDEPPIPTVDQPGFDNRRIEPINRVIESVKLVVKSMKQKNQCMKIEDVDFFT